jgi:hypothetical protein
MTTRRSLQEIYDGARPYRMHRWHHYIPIYAQHFARFRDRPINLLEIGVQYGGGLHMWHEYFHPESKIFGVDINPHCAKPELPNVKVFIGDQANPGFLFGLLQHLPRLDIVIDDGGHTMDQQITAFTSIYNQMAPDGIYLVEDTHTSLWGGEFQDRQADEDDIQTFMALAHQHTLRLMDWSGKRENFGTLMTDRRSELDGAASPICRSTQSITFYDSIVVYQRGPRTAPGHALR